MTYDPPECGSPETDQCDSGVGADKFTPGVAAALSDEGIDLTEFALIFRITSDTNVLPIPSCNGPLATDSEDCLRTWRGCSPPTGCALETILPEGVHHDSPQHWALHRRGPQRTSDEQDLVPLLG